MFAWVAAYGGDIQWTCSDNIGTDRHSRHIQATLPWLFKFWT